MKSKLFIFACLMLLCSTQVAFGQVKVQTNVIPPNPNAASLGKFGDLPVSLTTGVPNINIPIYTINEGSINIPIGLSYHAGGVKVEEIASWVGLGWTLNGYGAISRTVRGRADDEHMGLLEAPEAPLYATTGVLNGYSVGAYEENKLDGEPDLFYLNVPGYSVKFVMDRRRNIIVIPDQPIKIEVEGGGSGQFNDGFRNWKVQTPDNITYHFETSESMVYKSSAEWAITENATSTWYLTKIVDNTTKKEVIFNYETYTQGNYVIPGGWSQTEYLDLVNSSTNVITATNKRLQSIVFSQGSITFVPTTQQRSDWAGDKALDHILVKDNQNNIIKKVRFEYSYFNATGSQSVASTTPTSTSQTKLRLRLDKITESDGVKDLPPHIFEYNDTVFLPDRTTYSYDHWGYYNGKKDNTTPLPKMTIIIVDYNGIPKIKKFDGADRETYPNFVQAGILNKISYPTGGNTKFEYECHDTKSIGLPNPTVAKNWTVGQNAISSSAKIAKPFTISTLNPNDYVEITLTCELRDFDGYYDPSTSVLIEVIDALGNNVYPPMTFKNSNNDKHTFLVKGGNYVLYHACYSYLSTTNYTARVSYEEETAPSTNRKVGGLRIKKMTDNTEMGVAKTTTYTYEEENPAYSSGVLITIPDYAFTPNYVFVSFITRSSVSHISLGFTQGSHINYGRVTVCTTNTNETETNGKTVYEYTTATQYPDVYDSEFNFFPVYSPAINTLANLKFPYPPVDSRDWLRGLLKKQTIFKKDGAIWKTISQTSNTYTVISPDATKSMYADEYKKQVVGIKSGSQLGCNSYLTRFAISSGLALLTKTVEKKYDDNANAMESEVVYKYPFALTETPDYFNVKQIENQKAGANKEIRIMKYPQDILRQNTNICAYPTSLDSDYFKNIYTQRKIYQGLFTVLALMSPINSAGDILVGNGANDFYFAYKDASIAIGNIYNTNKTNYQTCLDNLLNTTYANDPHKKALALLEKQGRITTPVETEQYIEKSGQTYLLGASKSNFFIQNNNQILPNEGYETEFEGMITKAQFEANPSAYYKKKGEYLAFNNQGNILAFRGVNAPTTLYVYGYQNALPIAKVMASPLLTPNLIENNKIVQVFHTSFEEETTGVGSINPKTGKKYKTGTYTLVIGTTGTPLLGNRYTLTYWRRANSSSTWDLVTEQVNTNQIVNGVYTKNINDGEIDELRFFPAEALMTTYTYEPLVGMTSQTDTNNQTIYYEYDNFGRLKLVRDDKGNILKQHVYHYKGQQE